MTNEMTTTIDAGTVESVLLGGDLSKLTPEQRVGYYKTVCESVGLNPLTKPFEYINLNGKLTLYARKDATDQLRKINSVSIEDLDINLTDTLIIVTVKGRDAQGRTDVDVGVVAENDMRGNKPNAIMKAVTKGKRRLTLSLCGLGWLDETEVETIPTAVPVTITETGTIEVKATPTNGNRPYTPDVLYAKIADRTKHHEDKNTPHFDMHGNILAKHLTTTFDGDNTKRYELCKWLVGETSTKKMTGPQVMALLDWLGTQTFEEPPTADAISEAKTAHVEALKAEGQQELL